MSGYSIDFIPPAYRSSIRRTRVRRILIIGLSAGGVLIGLSGWSVRAAVLHRRAELHEFARFVDDTRAAAHHAEMMQQKIEEAKQKLQRQKDLTLPIEASDILATLCGLLPESTSLESLEMRVTTLRQGNKTNRSGKNHSLKAGGKKKKNEEEKKEKVLVCEVTGLSISDMDIADFVGRLTDNTLFRDVSLDYSKPTQVGEKEARAFRVSCLLDLDAKYIVTILDEKSAGEDEHPADELVLTTEDRHDP